MLVRLRLHCGLIVDLSQRPLSCRNVWAMVPAVMRVECCTLRKCKRAVALTWLLGMTSCVLPEVASTELDAAPALETMTSPSAADNTSVEQEPNAGAERSETSSSPASKPSDSARPLTHAAIATDGEPCDSPGSQACTQHAGFEQLICRDGKWTAYAACSGNTRCDTLLSPTQGTCQAVADGCVDKQPGRVCFDGKRGICDADLLSFVEEPCQPNAHCVDNGSEAACICAAGFTMKAKECVKSKLCPAGACGPEGTCIEDADDYHCMCSAKNVAVAHECLPRFAVHGDGTVTDRQTNRTWEKVASTASFTWSDALGRCQNLQLAGGAWHLPSIDELTSLLNLSGGVLLDGAAFPDEFMGWYWSSSLGNPASAAWEVEFFYGDTDVMDVTTLRRARCVR
jgi:hypothetical protein